MPCTSSVVYYPPSAELSLFVKCKSTNIPPLATYYLPGRQSAEDTERQGDTRGGDRVARDIEQKLGNGGCVRHGGGDEEEEDKRGDADGAKGGGRG